ncbi:hypothetical protein I7I50_05368 [Histoplasma capsulatum G186AR]|uniref:Uncharacterized protein n=1 Tax=Ajellomyces capsulatus TaxID=5037 RepID=A0A8H7ZC74_AJECA|nr:hypothetical protein I7I52_03629 [Histoplasma capsulatum]QSS76045.1 hypothetical protein I7I50_05368 [Histoplasma capsulatum G186AR]
MIFVLPLNDDDSYRKQRIWVRGCGRTLSIVSYPGSWCWGLGNVYLIFCPYLCNVSVSQRALKNFSSAYSNILAFFSFLFPPVIGRYIYITVKRKALSWRSIGSAKNSKSAKSLNPCNL